MPRRRHFYGPNHVHYLTASTYRRGYNFDSDRFKRKFVQTLDELLSALPAERSLPIFWHLHSARSYIGT